MVCCWCYIFAECRINIYLSLPRKKLLGKPDQCSGLAVSVSESKLSLKHPRYQRLSKPEGMYLFGEKDPYSALLATTINEKCATIHQLTHFNHLGHGVIPVCKMIPLKARRSEYNPQNPSKPVCLPWDPSILFFETWSLTFA